MVDATVPRKGVLMTTTSGFRAVDGVGLSDRQNEARFFGFGVKRLMDLPMTWSDQWSALGLKTPAQA